MRFFEEESVIFLCIVVASLAEVFDTLVQVLKIPIPNNFITFTAIILFFVSLLLKETRKNTLVKECLSEREKSIKNYANLSLKESTILKKYNKQSLYKLIIFFSLAWIVISTIFILFFANYFDKRHQLSWELILFFIVLFAIIGFAILAMSIISELKNTFPDFRKVFEISLEEEINKNMSFDYLVAVIKACQELEDTFNFPLEKLR